jgi:GNAT superfamily N-acetyltransferase
VLYGLKAKRIGRLRVLLLGVLPEYRAKGVDAALYHRIWHMAIANKIYWGEAGWILEDNPAMIAGMVKLGWRHYKTYRLYDRSL